MEETILEIIDKNYNLFVGVNEADTASSKEITAHVFEFTTWVTDTVRNYGCVYLSTETNMQVGNIKEVYDYWLKNVKK